MEMWYWWQAVQEGGRSSYVDVVLAAGGNVVVGCGTGGVGDVVAGMKILYFCGWGGGGGMWSRVAQWCCGGMWWHVLRCGSCTVAGGWEVR
jgi:hypothetical protein